MVQHQIANLVNSEISKQTINVTSISVCSVILIIQCGYLRLAIRSK